MAEQSVQLQWYSLGEHGRMRGAQPGILHLLIAQAISFRNATGSEEKYTFKYRRRLKVPEREGRALGRRLGKKIGQDWGASRRGYRH